MINKRKFFIGISGLSVMLITSACATSSDSESESSDYQSSQVDSEPDIEYNIDISGQTIYWLADYDLNPSKTEERSTALAIFEDIYNAKIEYIYTEPDKILDTLKKRILSGEPVDMIPFDETLYPANSIKEIYQPLDDYFDVLEWDTDLWTDMYDTAELFKYGNNHYVIPYSLSDPILIIYNKNLMKSEGLQDPYELYQKGEWNQTVFMDMMKTFVSKQTEDYTRYGIAGDFGKAVLQSSGKTIVSLENDKFINNIENQDIAKAENLMQEINQLGLYNSTWCSHFPTDRNTLFYGTADWSLDSSNAMNPDDELMVVPFPKPDNADDYYLSCNYNARMFVKGSDKGEAVATYIKCERIAETNDIFQKEKRENAIEKKYTADGILMSFITETQYDAIQSYLSSDTLKLFDFGYGMSSVMYSEGDYTFDTRGVMNNIESALLEGDENAEDWKSICEKYKPIIDQEINKLNS